MSRQQQLHSLASDLIKAKLRAAAAGGREGGEASKQVKAEAGGIIREIKEEATARGEWELGDVLHACRMAH